MEEFQNSREPFDQQGFEQAVEQTIDGTDGNDVLAPESPEEAPGLPGALSFWTFDNAVDGVFADARGGPAATVYSLQGNSAVVQTATPLTDGPDGEPNSALLFDGESTFGFIEHSPDLQVTQGTIALWMRPDDLSDDAIVVSKDQSGAGDGGHFRLGHSENGQIFIRFAEGDGGQNHAWTSSVPYLTEGEWAHIAVGFTDEGLTVYVNGEKIPDFGWIREEGNVDNPGLYKEAYLVANEEPFILGADTSQIVNNDTPDEFAADTVARKGGLDDAFTGAMADFGIWGGFSLGDGGTLEKGNIGTCGANSGPLCFCGAKGDSLTQDEIIELFLNGPGDALTSESGPEAIESGDDTINGLDGLDQIFGGGGNDTLNGGAGADNISGGYGDDILSGDEGNDVLEGGRGSDLLMGGEGNDVLVSRSDAGEQRIGQLVIGEPTRGDPDNEVNPEYQKLYSWEDQTLVADDILVGGAGADTYLFNPQINAKLDIILKHVEDDRTIDWAGVAGENNELHDHWVDSFGIDVIADYDASEDTIAIVGHTVAPEVTYKGIDTDGDGINDETVSIITVYSNQGGGGGAHTEDLIGQIIVHGDLVDEDDLIVDAGVTHGIVDTIDELQEALAPSGTTKVSTLSDGSSFNGYDSRDDQGNLGEVIENPEDFVDNPFLNSGLFELASSVPANLGPANPVATQGATSFNGEGQFQVIDHDPAMAQTDGSVALSFTADDLVGNQTLFSKDASGYVDGGHLTMWIDENGRLKVRFQSTEESIYLSTRSGTISPGEEVDVVFTFDEDQTALYINGVRVDVDRGFAAGMTGNNESLVLGASTTTRTSGQLNNLKDFFGGTIASFAILDRPLVPAEAFLLSEADGDLKVLQAAAESDTSEGESAGDSGGSGEGSSTGETGSGETGAGETGSGDGSTSGGGTGETGSGSGTGETGSAETGSDGSGSATGSGDGSTSDSGSGSTTPAAANSGDDTMRGSGASDTIEGGLGDDIIRGRGGDDTLMGEEGNDEIRGGAGNDLLDGGDGNDLLAGGRGDDIVLGGDGNDTLYGRRNNDTLDGGAGDDQLFGNGGADSLTGGAGNDTLTGNGGRDLFAFAEAGAANADTVTDFRSGIDSIVLDSAAFGLAAGALDANAFVSGPAALDADDRVIYDQASGRLYFDADGSGAGLAEEIAQFTNGVALDESDFQIV